MGPERGGRLPGLQVREVRSGRVSVTSTSDPLVYGSRRSTARGEVRDSCESGVGTSRMYILTHTVIQSVVYLFICSFLCHRS